MLTRKINAGLSLITTLLLLLHAITNAVWMLSYGRIAKPAPFLSWVLIGVMLSHVMISLDLAISAHANTDRSKDKKYVKMNLATNVQRMSGVALIVFTALHVLGTIGFTQPPQIVHAILPPVFFTVVMVHIAVSFSKALITLGIGNAAFIKNMDIVAKLVCITTLIADVIGFYLYVV